ncbi:phosphotransferase [Fodinisporobacter ferrooxydans]|uniref:Phosphotransferase n=1 Tax=Fodinisporobacter ferrooxydans TaxID=2901836 RepID=A0ABY4CQA3_9BACL|nr:phosphotransferase [Alicyclobacillaceae bacterium MYW30-H2]
MEKRIDSSMQAAIAAFPIHVKKVKRIKSNLYQLQEKDRIFCLKYYPSTTQLDQMTTVVKHVQNKGFKGCYQIIKTRSDIPYFHQNGDPGGWQLTRWVQGDHPDFQKPAQLRQAVLLLAEFHRHAVDVPLQESKKHQRYGNLLEQWEQRLTDLQQWSDEYNHAALKKAADIGEASIERLRKSPVRDVSGREKDGNACVHGDYNYPNLIRRPNGQLTVIDFENAAHDIRIRDLAHIIQRNVHKDPEAAKQLVRMYEKKRPLSKEERAVLAALLAFPYQFWRMIHLQRYHRKQVTDLVLTQWGKKYLSRKYSNSWRRMS